MWDGDHGVQFLSVFVFNLLLETRRMCVCKQTGWSQVSKSVRGGRKLIRMSIMKTVLECVTRLKFCWGETGLLEGISLGPICRLSLFWELLQRPQRRLDGRGGRDFLFSAAGEFLLLFLFLPPLSSLPLLSFFPLPEKTDRVLRNRPQCSNVTGTAKVTVFPLGAILISLLLWNSCKT